MTLPPPYTPARSIIPLRNRPAWNALQEHFDKVRDLHLRQLFADDPHRGERFTLEALGLYFDFSKNRITNETFRLLLDLAEESGLRKHIDAMFAGDKINVNRAARRSACCPARSEGRTNLCRWWDWRGRGRECCSRGSRRAR